MCITRDLYIFILFLGILYNTVYVIKDTLFSEYIEDSRTLAEFGDKSCNFFNCFFFYLITFYLINLYLLCDGLSRIICQ